MRLTLKIPGDFLDLVRGDLHRPHAFAAERVGFLTAGIFAQARDLLFVARDYVPVADDDYLRDYRVGAMIGPDAMRKAAQKAYGSRAALLHIHSHGGRGTPSFSGVDEAENKKFLPSFFNIIPQMPHGAIVLSDNSAHGMVWLDPKQCPVPIDQFVHVGAPYFTFGGL